MKKKKVRKHKIAKRNKEYAKRRAMRKASKLEQFNTYFFAFGVVLLIACYYFYDYTLISWQAPILIWLIIGIIATFLLNTLSALKLDEFMGKVAFPFRIIGNSIKFGSTVVFCIFLINFISPDINIDTHKLKIIDRSTPPIFGYDHPTAYVLYKGLKKSFTFYAGKGSKRDYERVKLDNSDFFYINTKKGNLGYDVVVDFGFDYEE